jgi:hypothetical protein
MDLAGAGEEATGTPRCAQADIPKDQGTERRLRHEVGEVNQVADQDLIVGPFESCTGRIPPPAFGSGLQTEGEGEFFG